LLTDANRTFTADRSVQHFVIITRRFAAGAGQETDCGVAVNSSMPKRGVPASPTLALRRTESHIQCMVATAKKTGRSGRSASVEGTVVYRGIKIEPVIGKRSPLARAIRDGFRAVAERSRDEPTKA